MNNAMMQRIARDMANSRGTAKLANYFAS